MAQDKRHLRCAVYTRKSSESGLEQNFNSLDAQREAGEAYIKSQKSEGWAVIKKQYNDGGFSGGTLDRPALKMLLEDIKHGMIDVVIVYKVDRLSRSLHDFAKLVELFDANDVTFVSVTQSFNTQDSMGRLTLNMLLSFAQFEREVTGERIRDKIEASRKKGLWMGGPPPLGYDVIDRKLIINADEAETVRYVFEGYLESESTIGFIDEMKVKGITGKSWTTQTGNYRQGAAFDRSKLYKFLHNKVYIGEAVHRDKSYPGEHDAIIDQDLWDAVQAKLDANNSKKDSNEHRSQALLKGLITDPEGNAFSPTYSQKHDKDTGHKRRTYYYLNQKAIKHGSKHCDVPRVQRDALEEIILDRVRKHATSWEQKDLLKGWKDMSYVERRRAIKILIKHVVLYPDQIKLTLNNLDGTGPDQEETLPFQVRKYGGRKLLLDEQGQELAPKKTNKDPALIKALVRAHKWDRTLRSGDKKSLEEIAKSEKLNNSYVHQIYRLVFLAPKIKEHILDGTQPRSLMLAKLMKGNVPLCWSEQKDLYGF